MKLNGKSIEPPKPKLIPIPRPGGQDIILCAAPIMDYKEFERLCPFPKPPLKMRPGRKPVQDLNHPQHAKNVNAWAANKMAYTIIASLSATSGLEWEKVDLNDPDTWEGYLEELSSVFTVSEVEYIVSEVFKMQNPDDDVRREALERFTSAQGEEKDQESLFPTDEQDSTQSSESVNVSG